MGFFSLQFPMQILKQNKTKIKRIFILSEEITKICQNQITVIFRDYCNAYGDLDQSTFGSKQAK